MESVIDERYRLKLLEYYLENPKEAMGPGGFKKWVFCCPFCGPQGRSESKRRERKAALLWNQVQHSWVFYCAKKGCVECMSGKTLGSLISALNPALGEAYKRERWHSGTTGKGHNCRAPERLVGVSTGSYGSIRSGSAPD
jgi:hypothetical protein